MTRLETLIKDISDPSVAEALKLLGGSPTPGGSGEPADSYAEVSTNVRDADGHMIFKKSFYIDDYSNGMLVNGDLTKSMVRIHHFTGYIENTQGSTRPLTHYMEGNYNCVPYVDTDGLHLYGGNGYGGAKVYVTIYYTYKSVN